MLFAAVLLLVTGLGQRPSASHQGERLYVIPEITEEMVTGIDLHDASINDWEDLLGEPSLTLLDFVPHPRSEIQQLDLADLDFRIWLGWNERTNRIYVGAIMSDDVYVNEYEPDGRWGYLSNHDVLNLALDGDHSGGRWAPEGTAIDTPEQQLFFNQQAQNYAAISYVKEGSTVSLPPTTYWWSDDWMVTPPYAEGGGGVYGENPVFWVVEFAVTPFDRMLWNDPGESLVSELKAGKIIGFDMWVGDRDRGPGSNWEDLYALNVPPEPDANADLFLDGLLLGAGATPGEGGSVVEDVSWGRIKAALEFE